MVKGIIAMLRTTLPGSDDGSFRRVFKALLPSEKEEKMKVLPYLFFFTYGHYGCPMPILFKAYFDIFCPR